MIFKCYYFFTKSLNTEIWTPFVSKGKEEAFTLGTGADKNDLDIVVKDSTGAAVACKAVGGEYSIDGTTNTTVVDTDDLQTGIHLRKSDGAGGFELFPAGPYTVVITPNTVGGDAHAPSAITLSVSIAE